MIGWRKVLLERSRLYDLHTADLYQDGLHQHGVVELVLSGSVNSAGKCLASMAKVSLNLSLEVVRALFDLSYGL